MALNSFFNNYNSATEQKLVEDLVIESIRIHGLNVYYLPRSNRDLDDVLNEDTLSEYTQALLIEMYVKNVDSFEGEGDFLSKFGLQIRDSMTMTVAQKVFNTLVGTPLTMLRPREGDLLYFPLNKKIFEIRHVEHEAVFYQFGTLQTYDLKCELFEFSNERFATGVTVIDTMWADRRIAANTTMSQLETIDALSDNFSLETTANTVISFTESNPFGDDQF